MYMCLYINSLLAKVLFNCGASHSFTSKKFAKALGVKPTRLDEQYRVSIPSDKVLISEMILRECHIQIADVELCVNLILIHMKDFDVILGMDWLSNNYVVVDFQAKKVKFEILGRPEFTFKGGMEKQVGRNLPIISSMEAKKALEKGCDGYLAYIVDKNTKD